MGSLVDFAAMMKVLLSFIDENGADFAFISLHDGGPLCCTDISNGRMTIEALSAVWTAFPDPNWERISVEWESSLVVLINTKDWVLGVQFGDPSPTSIGLFLHKTKVLADFISKRLAN